MTKKRFRVEGMHCVGCTMAVEGALEDLSGVKSARADYARQQTDIEFDETQVSEEQLSAVLAESGYKLILPPLS